jgi:hypothetical protein
MLKPDYYQIRIEGKIGSHWSDWFSGLTITSGPNNETILTGKLQDQADLHGVLMKIRDLHLALISVNRLTQPNEGE